MTAFKHNGVTVKITPPESLDATRRRLSAAVKARLAVIALERALTAARADSLVATGKLKGAEVGEYLQLTSHEATAAV